MKPTHWMGDLEEIQRLEAENTQLRAQCDSMLKEQMLRDKEIARLRAEVERLDALHERRYEVLKQCREDAESLFITASEMKQTILAYCPDVATPLPESPADNWNKTLAAHEQLVKGQP